MNDAELSSRIGRLITREQGLRRLDERAAARDALDRDAQEVEPARQ